MSTATLLPPLEVEPGDRTITDEPVVALKRRSIDAVLIGFGAVAIVVFLVAGGLLTWGYRFSDDYVSTELSSQNISFPPAEALNEEGRTDLLSFAGNRVDTGKEAEAYASFINGHLEGIADGATYADLGATGERSQGCGHGRCRPPASRKPRSTSSRRTADGVTGQRNSLFKGETLRGLLLSAYAWSTVGTIAGIAAIGAFLAAAVMACWWCSEWSTTAGPRRQQPPDSTARPGSPTRVVGLSRVAGAAPARPRRAKEYDAGRSE